MLVCVSACEIYHLFRPRLSIALSAHGTHASPGELCVLIHTMESPRAGAVGSRSELVELFRGIIVNRTYGIHKIYLVYI